MSAADFIQQRAMGFREQGARTIDDEQTRDRVMEQVRATFRPELSQPTGRDRDVHDPLPRGSERESSRSSSAGCGSSWLTARSVWS